MKGDQINSIVISAVYRSCAIPIAWHILPANRPGEWIAPTVSLLALLSEAVPQNMTVLVMCDRGLRSPRLWKQICSVGWHPYARQSINTVFCPTEELACQRGILYLDQGTHMLGLGQLSGPRANGVVEQ